MLKEEWVELEGRSDSEQSEILCRYCRKPMLVNTGRRMILIQKIAGKETGITKDATYPNQIRFFHKQCRKAARAEMLRRARAQRKLNIRAYRKSIEERATL